MGAVSRQSGPGNPPEEDQGGSGRWEWRGFLVTASWHMVEGSQDGMCGKGNTFLFGLKMIENIFLC